jgi:hypothetical protein
MSKSQYSTIEPYGLLLIPLKCHVVSFQLQNRNLQPQLRIPAMADTWTGDGGPPCASFRWSSVVCSRCVRFCVPMSQLPLCTSMDDILTATRERREGGTWPHAYKNSLTEPLPKAFESGRCPDSSVDPQSIKTSICKGKNGHDHEHADLGPARTVACAARKLFHRRAKLLRGGLDGEAPVLP